MNGRWTVRHTKTFYRELSRLPPAVREKIEAIAFGEAIQTDPHLGGRVEKLKGSDDYYKIRVGDYRVGLHLDMGTKTIQFRRVLHRRDIYRYFP
jgi:mRNA interferase RelE/StbE